MSKSCKRLHANACNRSISKLNIFLTTGIEASRTIEDPATLAKDPFANPKFIPSGKGWMVFFKDKIFAITLQKHQAITALYTRRSREGHRSNIIVDYYKTFLTSKRRR